MLHNRNMIVAMDRMRGIGLGGKIPWRLKMDMRFFRETTSGERNGREENIVIMGRKTWESIPEDFRPLRERLNVVLSKDKNFKILTPNCIVLRSVEDFLSLYSSRRFFVIGGGEIYKAFIPHVSRIYITHVDTIVRGMDTFFPELNGGWKGKPIFGFTADKNNQFNFSIVEYTCKPPVI